EETARACLPATFPFVVRHGRVLLDNTDALPGLEQMTDPETADSWYEIPNGAYRVTVHPIDQSSEAKRVLPDYVITFEPVDDAAGITVADEPPWWPPYRDRVPWQPGPKRDRDIGFTWPDERPNGEAFPTLITNERVALLPGQSAESAVSEDVASAVFPGDW